MLRCRRLARAHLCTGRGKGKDKSCKRKDGGENKGGKQGLCIAQGDKGKTGRDEQHCDVGARRDLKDQTRARATGQNLQCHKRKAHERPRRKSQTGGCTEERSLVRNPVLEAVSYRQDLNEANCDFNTEIPSSDPGEAAKGCQRRDCGIEGCAVRVSRNDHRVQGDGAETKR